MEDKSIPPTGKRKTPEEGEIVDTPQQESATQKRQNVTRSCVHEVAVPSDYTFPEVGTNHGTLSNPVYEGELAKTYKFELDPFQKVSIACLERNESVLVSAHTSAGKTVVAEYAIAMAFRDKQRVIYTSPLKALSNQKYRELQHEFEDVGLMTGDVTLSPNASCLVMTTEILRGMLYRGSQILKEVAWVIFDEIHYMKDRERGVVWEETIIFLPPQIKMVFLSATMSNATEFAEWICRVHKQPCHVVYTDFRPTPLQHYVFPRGGSGLYLVVDENEQFREDNFMKLQDSFSKDKIGEVSKMANGKASGRIAKSGNGPGGSDIYKIVKVRVREGGTDWGWGVVVNVVKKPSSGIGTLPSRGCGYIVDTLLNCTPGSSESGSRPRPCPPRAGEKGEMHVVPVELPLISALSKVRIAISSDLRPLEARQSILIALEELRSRFPEGLPKLNPVKDMKIEDAEIVNLVNKIEELERKLYAHPSHKSQDVNQIRSFQRKSEVDHEVQQLKLKMRDSQLQKFRDELKNRSRVLKRLGHIDADGVVQLKGRAACLIDTGDELLVTELMFNGTFNELDHHQVAALASCFIPVDKSSEQIRLRTELAKPLQQLQESARKIAEIQYECKLEIDVDEYVASTVRPFLLDVIYCWSKGASFAEVIQMTDIFEGSVIRSARRLDEFLNQLRAAAEAVGETSLEEKFEAASKSLQRGIMFANSLYL
ncbi:DExH-box ATP-dependent RNA helicase DExH10 [Linum perenne]